MHTPAYESRRPGTWVLDLQVIRPDPYVEQEGEVVEPMTASRCSPRQKNGCDSTDVNKKERRRQAGATPTRRETLEVDALLADLDRARKMFEAAEMPIPRREGLAVDRELKPLRVGPLARGRTKVAPA
jgi:hypothetical protein